MNKHYERYLREKYKPLYERLSWGFAIGDGWFNIINTLSARLCSDWLHAKYEYDEIASRIGQPEFEGQKVDTWNPIITQNMVDRRFAKMNEAYETIPRAIQVKEKFGGLRFYMNGGTESHNAFVSFAESMSDRTCEVCGERGKRRGGGWIRTLCNKHEAEHQVKLKERDNE